MAFEDLTLVPIQTKMLEPTLLTGDEEAWLDAYHARVSDALHSYQCLPVCTDCCRPSFPLAAEGRRSVALWLSGVTTGVTCDCRPRLCCCCPLRCINMCGFRCGQRCHLVCRAARTCCSGCSATRRRSRSSWLLLPPRRQRLLPLLRKVWCRLFAGCLRPVLLHAVQRRAAVQRPRRWVESHDKHQPALGTLLSAPGALNTQAVSAAVGQRWQGSCSMLQLGQPHAYITPAAVAAAAMTQQQPGHTKLPRNAARTQSSSGRSWLPLAPICLSALRPAPPSSAPSPSCGGGR